MSINTAYSAREPYREPEEQGGKPWLEITLLTAFIVSLLVGLMSLAVFFLYYNSTGADLADDPLTAFDPERILPSLAIKYLAGDSANPLAYQALNAGELNTAHALALFDTVAYGSQRSGLANQLARSLQESEYADQAGQVYKLARRLPSSTRQFRRMSAIRPWPRQPKASLQSNNKTLPAIQCTKRCTWAHACPIFCRPSAVLSSPI